MPQIHPMAVVERGAELADDVIVGPFAYVGPHVKLGRGCVVQHHASLEGHTTAGEGNTFFPHSAIGCVSQDLKYKGGRCTVEIGDHNVFRENVTVHIGTEVGGGVTRIGSHNLLMVGVHIAHDSILGNHILMANNVLLAGHVVVEDYANIAGAAGISHFVTIGRYSFTGGLSGVTRDVPPFMMANGHPIKISSINRVGLARHGFSEERLEALKTACRLLFGKTAMSVGMTELEALYPDNPDIKELLEFLRASNDGKHGRYRESLRGKTSWKAETQTT